MSGKFLLGNSIVSVETDWREPNEPIFTVVKGEESWKATPEQVVENYKPVSDSASIVMEVAEQHYESGEPEEGFGTAVIEDTNQYS